MKPRALWRANRTCPICGQSYRPCHRPQIYCSPQCLGMAQRGTRHPRWKGGCVSRGYHVFGLNGRKVYEHRYVMEQHLGRPLEPGEVVHHKDGNGMNNDPSNLVLIKSHRAHSQTHATYRSTTQKQCHRCLVIKPRDEFSPGIRAPSADAHDSWCKKCRRQANILSYIRRRKSDRPYRPHADQRRV
jgi:hypothetical protein